MQLGALPLLRDEVYPKLRYILQNTIWKRRKTKPDNTSKIWKHMRMKSDNTSKSDVPI